MSKLKEIMKMLGLSVHHEGNQDLYRLIEINNVENVYKIINREYPDNYLYEQNILEIEAIIEKYDKIILR